VAGTRGYAPPEAATARAAQPAQDVYSLAVCLAETALARRLFNDQALVEAAARGDAPPEAARLEPALPRLTAALRRHPAPAPRAPPRRPSATSSPAPLPPPGAPPGEPAPLLSALTARAQTATLDDRPPLPAAGPGAPEKTASRDTASPSPPATTAAFGPPP